MTLSADRSTFPKLADNGTQATVQAVVRDYAPISRSRIAAYTSLPLAAVSRSVSRLLQKELLTESPLADTHGSRRKRGLRLNPEAGYVLAVDYSPEGLEGAIVDTSYGTVFADVDRVRLGALSRDDRIDCIVRFVEKLREQAPDAPCLGLAAMDPGLVDSQAGYTVICTIMDDWEGVPIVESLQKRLKLPVMLPNAMMAKVRAIDRLEVDGNVQSLIYVEYSDGIACGMKLHGHYMSGESNAAGELGHTRVTDRDIPCRCGSVGCLEAVAALPALARDAEEALAENSNSSLRALEAIAGMDVMAAAADGDRLASRIVGEAFEYLGRGVATAVNLLDPQVVLLDNRVSKAGAGAVDKLMRSLVRNVRLFHSDKIQLRISELESHVGALGGAACILDYCMRR